MVGNFSETNVPELFEYGIHTEGSDIRAHVGAYCRMIYVFETCQMVEWLDKHDYEKKTATQVDVNGRNTADGWPVPIKDVSSFVRCLQYKSYPWHTFPPREADLSQKGKAAVGVILRLLELGRFPIWIRASEDDRKAVQIMGTDILLYAKKKIQVKCDYLAGPKDLGGTGNLYIQTHERNYNRKY